MDGRVLKYLILGGRQFERILILGYIAEQLSSGVRPRDWNRRWIQESAEAVDGSHNHLLAVYYAYNWAYDSEKGEAAGRYLEQLLASPYRLGVMDGDKLAVEAGIYQAWFRRDRNKALAWMERMVAKNKLNENDLPRGILFKYWILGEKAELQRIFESKLAEIQGMPPSGKREMMLSIWTEFRDDLLFTQIA